MILFEDADVMELNKPAGWPCRAVRPPRGKVDLMMECARCE